MIGDEYLQVRAQLGTALFSLSTLAHGLHAGRDVLQTLHDLRNDLRAPFLFVVIGGSGAGKSSLIDALLGREIYPDEAAPATESMLVFKYGAEEARIQVNAHFAECHRPSTLLRDFNIVDTPGANALSAGQCAMLEEWLPGADAVFFVFSMSDPWSDPVWKLLNLVKTKRTKNTIIVLQQSDLREGLEIEAIRRHMEQKLREQFAPGARVFPVSARMAYLSKTTGADKEGLYQRSMFGSLESYIDDTVTLNRERIARLRTASDLGRFILKECGRQTNDVFDFVTKDVEKLTDLTMGLEELKAEAARHAGGLQWALAQAYERLHKRGIELLDSQLSLGKTFKAANAPQEEAAGGDLTDGIARQLQNALETLENHLRQTWQESHGLLRKRFTTHPREAHSAEIVGERKRILQGVEFGLAERISDPRFGARAEPFFKEVAEWLHVPLETMKEEGLAAFAEPLARLAVADLEHAMELSMGKGGKLWTLLKKRNVLARFHAEIGRMREELLATLESRLQKSVAALYEEVHALFRPLQAFCTRQKGIFEPRLSAVRQMEETFEKVEAWLARGAERK